MSKILITGAAGKLGDAIIRHLLETYGVAPGNIVAASRDPGKLKALSAKGVETRKVDFDDAASLPAAFAGIDRLLIVSTDALAVPGQRLKQHKAAVDAAQKAGVKFLAYTSMPKPDDSLIPFAPDHLGTEQAVISTGLPHAIFRNGWYMENYFMSLPHALAEGKLYTSTGAGRVANVARDDIARAIAAVLASEAPQTAIYTLTGAETFNTDEVAAIVRDVTGKALDVFHVSDEQLAGGLKAAGLPDFMIPVIVSFDSNTREGKIDLVTGDIEKLSGKKPQSLKAFFEAHKASFAH